MELKKYKYIKNTQPQYDLGKMAPISGVDISSTIKNPTFDLDGKMNEMNTKLSGMKFKTPTLSKFDASKFAKGFNTAVNIAGDAVGAYSAVNNAFNAPIKTGAQMNQEAGTNNTSIGGVNVQLQNSVDTAAQTSELEAENKSNTMAAAGSGAKVGGSIGSLFGPLGNALGTVAGGFFGGIAGIFGGKRRKRALEERMRIMRGQQQYNNSVQMDTAMSTAMNNDWNSIHENTQDDLLYANKGKDSMRKYNNGKVWSPAGYGYGATNSKVGLGESIVNFRTGKGTLVTKGTKGVDDQDSSVRPGDDNTIFGNVMNPYSGMLFSDQAAPLTAKLQQINAMSAQRRKNNQSSLSEFTQQVQRRELEKAKQQTLGQLQELANQQEAVHMATGEGSYNCGKLPRFNDGDDAVNQYLDDTLELPTVTVGNEKPAKKNGSFWSNLNSLLQKDNSGLGDYHTIPALAGVIAGYDQYNRANSQEARGSNIYVPNTYAQRALQGLAEQRIDPYSYMRPMYDAERRGAYQINNSGGMSGGQRQLSRVALALGSQQNMADALRDAYEKNLAYKNTYYNAMLNEGERDAARRQSANQYDFDTFTKAHSAKEQMRQVGINNMLQALGNYQKNRFTRDMGRQQLSLYNRSLSADNQKLLRELAERIQKMGELK